VRFTVVPPLSERTARQNSAEGEYIGCDRNPCHFSWRL
jgi:hypothetical protein